MVQASPGILRRKTISAPIAIARIGRLAGTGTGATGGPTGATVPLIS